MLVYRCDGGCGAETPPGQAAEGWRPYLLGGEVKHVCPSEECRKRARDEYRAEMWRRKEAERT